MNYFTRRSVARMGAVGRWLTSGRFPHIEALGVCVRNGNVAADELRMATTDIMLPADLPLRGDVAADAAERLLAAVGVPPAELKRRMMLFLSSLQGAVMPLRDLAEPEQSRFREWLRENRCTAPVLRGISEPDQDAFYVTDLNAFREGRPAPD